MQRLLNVAPRQAYRVALNVTVEGKSKNRPFLCRTENISASGMLIRAEGAFAQDDRISFSFYLPDGTRVGAHGNISRIIKQGTAPDAVLYGIQFADLAPDDKSAIEAFVRKEADFKRS
jgi:c-di-GMP-binding flagellar brake protein YcgR